MKDKSRILIPDGRTLVGCVDECGVLEYEQVFVQIRDYYSGTLRVITGPVVVAKHPVMHTGA